MMSEDSSETHDELVPSEVGSTQVSDEKSAPSDRSTSGPFDLSEVPGMRPYVDLGGIKIAPREGLQMRLEVDDRTKRVVAVTLEYQGSILQVQAFSAPKSTGLWHQVRHEISQQLSNQGGKTHIDEGGPLGPELEAITALPAEQGGGTRIVRFIGVDGPRWLLRGVIMGKATADAAARAQLNELFREIVVVRGDQPMPPSELLPLQIPAGVNPNQASGDPEQA